MHAIVWRGKKTVNYLEKPKPLVTDPTDILLKVTATTICGSDLHLYTGSMLDMQDGDILGHEFMGIVEDVGSEVKKLKKGDRVVVAFDIACGFCDYCKREEYTGCDTTNPSKLIETLYGHRPSALYGYSHLTGGVPGGQSEYVRVPFADVNCLPIPNDVPDEQALYLSDVVPTAYHGCVMADVKEGSTVGIWGLGPVGLMAARWCQILKAGKIIGIDCVPERLALAKSLGIEVINFKEESVPKAIAERFAPGGLDCAIECAGFEYPFTLLHKVERALTLETDTADIFDQMFFVTRKFGTVGVIGVYTGYANHFPVGAMMEKGLMVRGSQSPTQKYWKMALEKIRSKELDPTFIVTHRGTLADAPDLYKKFHGREDGCIKVFLRP
jgi:threonine dehydrogenase-like Zn-dependent dehydrogenase